MKNKLNIPNTLKIGTQTVKVVRRPLAEMDDEGNGGLALWEANTLVLATDMPRDRMEQIFIHEILHFINIYLEEEAVTYLAECLYQVFTENKIIL